MRVSLERNVSRTDYQNKNPGASPTLTGRVRAGLSHQAITVIAPLQTPSRTVLFSREPRPHAVRTISV